MPPRCRKKRRSKRGPSAGRACPHFPCWELPSVFLVVWMANKRTFVGVRLASGGGAPYQRVLASGILGPWLAVVVVAWLQWFR